MKIRMGKLASGLALVLLSAGLGGCQLLGSEKASEANDSSASAPKEAIPAEKVQPKEVEAKSNPKSVTLVAATPLTRPTDPDVRVKAIKKGRSNPFAELVSPATTKAQPLGNGGSQSKSNSKALSKPNLAAPKSALGKKKPAQISKAPKSSKELPRLTSPTEKTTEIVLPPLPEPTLAKQVSVQGVMMLGAEPKAIVKAPNESVARTVKAGDYLSNGQILVASIDMSNPQNPNIILKESGQTVTVGVGRPAESMAAALPF